MSPDDDCFSKRFDRDRNRGSYEAYDWCYLRSLQPLLHQIHRRSCHIRSTIHRKRTARDDCRGAPQPCGRLHLNGRPHQYWHTSLRQNRHIARRSIGRWMSSGQHRSRMLYTHIRPLDNRHPNRFLCANQYAQSQSLKIPPWTHRQMTDSFGSRSGRMTRERRIRRNVPVRMD
jgi:hypothetical protein